MPLPSIPGHAALVFALIVSIAAPASATDGASAWATKEGGATVAWGLGVAKALPSPQLAGRAALEARTNVCGFVEGLQLNAGPSLDAPLLVKVTLRCDATDSTVTPAPAPEGEARALARIEVPRELAWLGASPPAPPPDWWTRQGAWSEPGWILAVAHDADAESGARFKAAALVCGWAGRHFLAAESTFGLKRPRECTVRGLAWAPVKAEEKGFAALAWAPVPPGSRPLTSLDADDRKELVARISSKDREVRVAAWPMAAAAGLDEAAPLAFADPWNKQFEERDAVVAALRELGPRTLAAAVARFDATPSEGEGLLVLELVKAAGLQFEAGAPTAKVRAFLAPLLGAWHTGRRAQAHAVFVLFPPDERQAMATEALAGALEEDQLKAVLGLFEGTPPEAAIVAARKHAADKAAPSRAAVAAFLARAPSAKGVVDALTRLAADKDPAVRTAAVTALAQPACAPSAEKALLVASADKVAQVRAAAIGGLVRLGTKKALARLTVLSRGPDQAVVEAARAATP